MSKPQPRPDDDSAAFWRACARGELIGQNCDACGRWRWPPREHCADCHAAAPKWQALAPYGTVAGAVVLHRPFEPAFADAIPLMIAQVVIDDTDSQFILTGNLVPPMPVAEAIGQRVEISFQDRGDTAVPHFTIFRDQ